MKINNSFFSYMIFLVVIHNNGYTSSGENSDLLASEVHQVHNDVFSSSQKCLFRLLQVSMMIHCLNAIFTTFNILISMKILFASNNNNNNNETRLLSTVFYIDDNNRKVDGFIKNIITFFTSWQNKYVLQDANGFVCTADNKKYAANITFTLNCPASKLSCNVSSSLPYLDKAVVNCTEPNSTNIVIKSLENQVTELTNTVDNLTITVNVLKNNNTQLIETITSLNKTVSVLTEENQILSKQVTNLENINMNLTQQIDNLTSTNQNLVKEINALHINVTSLQNTITSLNKNISMLTTENQILSKQVTNLQNINMNLTQQIINLTSINQNLLNQISNLTSTNQDLLNQINNLTQINSNLSQQLQTAQQEINRMHNMNNFLAYTQPFSYFTLVGYIAPMLIVLVLNTFMLKQNKFSFSNHKKINRYIMYNVLIFCINIFFIITCLFFDGFTFSLRIILNMSITIINTIFNIASLRCHKKFI